MAILFPDKLKSNNPAAYGIVDATEVSGHRTVSNTAELYLLKDCILSKSGTNANNDALGQEWYVSNIQTKYKLINWANRHTAAGWQKITELNNGGLPVIYTISYDEKLDENVKLNGIYRIEDDVKIGTVDMLDNFFNGLNDGVLLNIMSNNSNSVDDDYQSIMQFYTNYNSNNLFFRTTQYVEDDTKFNLVGLFDLYGNFTTQFYDGNKYPIFKRIYLDDYSGINILSHSGGIRICDSDTQYLTFGASKYPIYHKGNKKEIFDFDSPSSQNIGTVGAGITYRLGTIATVNNYNVQLYIYCYDTTDTSKNQKAYINICVDIEHRTYSLSLLQNDFTNHPLISGIYVYNGNIYATVMSRINVSIKSFGRNITFNPAEANIPTNAAYVSLDYKYNGNIYKKDINTMLSLITAWGTYKPFTDFLQTTITTEQTVKGYVDFQGGAGNSGSDMRFKSNIKPLNSILHKVSKLSIIEYDWNKRNEERHTFGLNAAQVKKLFPLMWHERNDDTKTQWLEYDRTGVIALKAIQEQQEIIKKQKKNIYRLQKENDQIQKELKSLKKDVIYLKKLLKQ